MSEFIEIADAFYVRASSSRVDDRTRVLKTDDTFAVLDRIGDIPPFGGHHGVYHRGTRFLSRLELKIDGETPLLLSSTLKADNSELMVDFANPHLAQGERVLAANLVHVFRTTLIGNGVFHQRFRVRSYAIEPIDLVLTLLHEGDFRDIFEVRGTVRERRGELLKPEVGEHHVVWRYRGLDDVVRTLRIESEPPPLRTTANATDFACHLQPKGEFTMQVVCQCEIGENGAGAARLSYQSALQDRQRWLQKKRAGAAAFHTSNPACNAWLRRSVADLHMMLTDTREGSFPYAGVPWYSTAFGRDAILTAFECLLIEPRIARGVLGYLAKLQARDTDETRDAQPGKILHEQREGEMASLGEVPFGRYYGSVDATPLFVMLAGAYWRRSGDLEFLRALWPHVEAALTWCARDGEHAFVSYARRSPQGLVNQGWKDSHDAVFHADGSMAQGPIALCEVQGYAYCARVLAADVAEALGLGRRAAELHASAAGLRDAFEQAFWCEDLGTYALALDGAERPCRVRTSNPGHCLWTGIVAPERAAKVVAALMAEDSWTGFGIRTVSDRELRFNPMGYHNGSVWPHDNALIARGMARYGFRTEAQQVLTAMLQASELLDLHRLPELFCGLHRRPDEGPTLYPVACAPQSWAVASVFLLLQSCLGLEVDGVRGVIVVDHPELPPWLDRLTLGNLEVGHATVDLRFQRRAEPAIGTDVAVLRGDLRVDVIE